MASLHCLRKCIMFIRRMFNLNGIQFISISCEVSNSRIFSEIMEAEVEEDASPKNLLSQRMWEICPIMLFRETLTKYFQI